MVEADLEDLLQREFREIAPLSFVKLRSPIEKYKSGYFAFLEFNIEKPSLGIYLGIREKEIVGILFPPDYPVEHPTTLISENFPYVQHQHVFQAPDGSLFKSICLTRDDSKDWWCGKTLFELVLAIRDWLNDAASENLVKPDDPFEPLIADARFPVVELDVTEARMECEKYGGLWETTSYSMNIPGSSESRLILGGGDITTLVWYQFAEQAAAWTKRPDTLQELEALIESVGFDRKRFDYWINKGRDLTHKLIIIGVKRPRSVLGRPDNDEWVAFDLVNDRRSQQLKVRTHLVHQSFTRELARKLSGYSDSQLVRKILIIGAGALGSAAAEILIRSGYLSVILIDDDLMQPHNLSRHILGNQEIGAYKSQALVEKFRDLYRHDGNVAEFINKNIFDLSDAECTELNNKIDLVLDCSASPAVMRFLSDSGLWHKPGISAYQVDHGNGTIILYSPNVGEAPLFMNELSCVAQWRKVPVIHRWLAGERDPVDIGGGCRSVSSTISHAKTMFGASVLSDQILLWLTSEGLPRISTGRLFAIPTLSSDHSDSFRIEFDSQKVPISNWTIFMPDSVASKLKQIALRDPTIETGGILLGHTDRQKRHFYVVDSIECEGARTGNGFLRFPSNIRYMLAVVEKSAAGMIHYVGEWHSHPRGVGCNPSHIDRVTMADLATSLIGDRFPAFCVISDGEEFSFYVFESPKFEEKS